MKRSGILCVILALCLVSCACAETAGGSSVWGEVNGETYENPFFGLGFTCSNDLTLMDRDLMAMNNGINAEEMTDEEALRLMDAGKRITVMIGTYFFAREIYIRAESIENSLEAFDTMGLKGIAENTVGNTRKFQESRGRTDVRIRVEDVTVGDEAAVCIAGSFDPYSAPGYFREIWLRRGKYLVRIYIETDLTDLTEEIASGLYLLPER